jgi:hypothetical protein
MKAFYSQLEKADEKSDARLAQLAEVRKADLGIVQSTEALSPWDWWTGE